MDIDQLEAFAYAEDRARTLEQLIPGTEEYYFYRCLHQQHSGDLDQVDKQLAQWIKLHGRTSKVVEIEHRQALLAYARQPGATLDYLKSTLNLYFDHQQEIEGRAERYASRLDRKAISRDVLKRIALDRYSNSLDGFRDRALRWLT
jgi:hypothetical protein